MSEQNEDNSFMRYNCTCPNCFRIYKDKIPLPSKSGVAVVWCTVCKIVLCRFDWGKKSYSEDEEL